MAKNTNHNIPLKEFNLSEPVTGKIFCSNCGEIIFNSSESFEVNSTISYKIKKHIEFHKCKKD